MLTEAEVHERDALVDVIDGAAEQIDVEAHRGLLIANAQHDVVEPERCEHRPSSPADVAGVYSRRSTGSGFSPSSRNVVRNPTTSASATVATTPIATARRSKLQGASRTQRTTT